MCLFSSVRFQLFNSDCLVRFGQNGKILLRSVTTKKAAKICKKNPSCFDNCINVKIGGKILVSSEQINYKNI